MQLIAELTQEAQAEEARSDRPQQSGLQASARRISA